VEASLGNLHNGDTLADWTGKIGYKESNFD
jgi:hypothetical protein